MKKNKRALKFNFVDFIIALLIVAFVAFIYRYSYLLPDAPENNTEIYEHIELVFECVNENSGIGEVKIGDAVVDIENGVILGEITEVTQPSEEGERMTVSVSCYVNFSGEYYSYNDKKIIIGNIYKLSSPQMYFDAECILIRRLNDNNISNLLNATANN